MVDVLTVYQTYLPKIINVALKLPKLLKKNLLASFLWTQCICTHYEHYIQWLKYRNITFTDDIIHKIHNFSIAHVKQLQNIL